MNRSIAELKVRAKKLHKSALSGNQSTLDFLKLTPSSITDLQRKTCLNLLAKRYGFKDWRHAKDVLSGSTSSGKDMGQFWYSNQCSSLLNHWFADYHEAKIFLKENPDLYLLPFKNQFMVVAKDFIKTIGLAENNDAAWTHIHHDMVAYYGSAGWHQLVWERVLTLPKP